MDWSTSCPDWESRLINGQSIIPPPIFPDEAEYALSIFKQLRVVDLPGKPTFGECSDQWVFDFVSAIYGAYDAKTGRQLIREYLLEIAKKNTKSTIASGIMLTAVILCWREDEEHLILAPTKEVADASFKPAAGMIRADPELESLFHVQDHLRTITHRVTRASLKVVAADTTTVSGKKSGRILVDELWLFGKKPNAESMFMEATGGQISREEGWVIYLTTQSDEPPAGVFKDKLDYFRDVRDGIIHDPRSLGVLYEFPKSMIDSKAYLLEENFRITNPNIGRSVSSEWLVDNLKKNQQKVDGSFQQFLAKHLNIEIGINLRADRWAGIDFWEAGNKKVTLADIFDKSDVITIGGDGGGLDDLLGLCVLGRDREDNMKWRAWFRAWCNPIALERRKSEAPRYLDFEKDGDLRIVPMGQDVDEFCEIVKQCDESGLLDRIGLDPSGIGAIVDRLRILEIELEKDRGTDKARIVGVTQGWRLNGAIKDTERKLAEGSLYHDGSRMMNWIVGNARVEIKGSNTLITKQISGVGKIDPIIALLCAVSLMTMNPEARGGNRNIYEAYNLIR